MTEEKIDFEGDNLFVYIDKYNRNLDKIKKDTIKTLDEILNVLRKSSEKVKADNPYKAMMEEAKKQQTEMTANIGKYKNLYDKQLAVDKWYSQEFLKIQKNNQKMSEESQFQAFFDLTALYDEKKAQATEELVKKHTEKLGDIVQSGLTDMVVDCEDFDSTIKSMVKQLQTYMVQQAMQWARSKIGSSGLFGNILGSIGGAMSGFSGFGKVGTFVNGIKSIFKFHDGGIVPAGANMELGGTKEQLALLKGGERVLSPGENVSYNSSGNQASPVVFNNFNVKAWDSKDVSRYLLENKQLLNQITFEGIKYNNAQLRNMVRNA